MNRITLRREASTRSWMSAHYPSLESTVSLLSSLIVRFSPSLLPRLIGRADLFFGFTQFF